MGAVLPTGREIHEMPLNKRVLLQEKAQAQAQLDEQQCSSFNPSLPGCLHDNQAHPQRPIFYDSFMQDKSYSSLNFPVCVNFGLGSLPDSPSAPSQPTPVVIMMLSPVGGIPGCSHSSCHPTCLCTMSPAQPQEKRHVEHWKAREMPGLSRFGSSQCVL